MSRFARRMVRQVVDNTRVGRGGTVQEARIEKPPEGQVPVNGPEHQANTPGIGVNIGSPHPRRKVEWIADETAARYGASVAKTTGRDTEAYGELPELLRVRPPKPFAR
jgi:hypothetical protein